MTYYDTYMFDFEVVSVIYRRPHFHYAFQIKQRMRSNVGDP